MRPLGRILVGYDFLPEGELALRAAQTLAERTASVLHLVHVVEPSPAYAYKLLLSERVPLEEVATRVRLELQTLVENVKLADLRVETFVVIGKPVMELLRICREWLADLVVVGVSLPGEERFLGSTVERLVRKSPVGVLVAKQELSRGPKTILVPTDFSECARHAAEQAIALAQIFGGKVVFLHVVELYTSYPFAYSPPPLLKGPITAEELEPEWRDFLQRLPLSDAVAWETLTQAGHLARTIAQTAKDTAADLVVIGTHGGSGLAGMLIGRVAEKVIRITECSVMTVRPKTFHHQLPHQQAGRDQQNDAILQ